MPSDSIRLNVPAIHKYLNVVCACVTEMLMRVPDVPGGESTIYNVQLAVQELCANVVDHAYGDTPGRIELNFQVDEQPRRLVVEVRDTGSSFDPTIVSEPELDSAQVHGYGLFLIRQLMDEVSYHSNKGGNEWILVKNL